MTDKIYRFIAGISGQSVQKSEIKLGAKEFEPVKYDVFERFPSIEGTISIKKNCMFVDVWTISSPDTLDSILNNSESAKKIIDNLMGIHKELIGDKRLVEIKYKGKVVYEG